MLLQGGRTGEVVRGGPQADSIRVKLACGLAKANEAARCGPERSFRIGGNRCERRHNGATAGRGSREFDGSGMTYYDNRHRRP